MPFEDSAEGCKDSPAVLQKYRRNLHSRKEEEQQLLESSGQGLLDNISALLQLHPDILESKGEFGETSRDTPHAHTHT